MNKRLTTTTLRRMLLPWAGLIVSMAHADAVHADSVKAQIHNVLPAYTVVGNGSVYTQVQGGLVASGLVFDVVADAEIGGQVRSVSYSASGSITGGAGGAHSLPTKNDSRSFTGLWNKKRVLAGSYPIEAADLVAACNRQADALRAQGLGDGEIFDQDRQMMLAVSVMPDASFSLPSPFMDQVPDSETTRVTCKRWSGMSGFTPPVGLAATDGVSDSSLTLIEQYGPSGLCKVVLSGVIRTTAADMEVRFRYEHHDGKKSDVKTVTTDASKTAFFSHGYPIPNEPGPEGGSFRMVGVSPSFSSAAAAYSMNCGEGGPSGIQASMLPELELDAEPAGQVVIGSQVCPAELRLKGTIAAQGGGTTAGQAFFVGPGYASAHHAYQVSNAQTVVIEDAMPLEWDTELGIAFGDDPGQAPLKSQTVTAGFNVMGSDNTEIGNVPQQSFNVWCHEKPGPGMPGAGFSAGGGTPTSPSTGPQLSQSAINGNAPAAGESGEPPVVRPVRRAQPPVTTMPATRPVAPEAQPAGRSTPRPARDERASAERRRRQ